MILSQIKIHPAPGCAAAIIDVLQSVQVMLASLPDCLLSTVSCESGENGVILYQEKWRSRKALDDYLRSGTFTRVLEALELSCRNPEVTFFDGLEVGGLEIVELARSHSAQED